MVGFERGRGRMLEVSVVTMGMTKASTQEQPDMDCHERGSGAPWHAAEAMFNRDGVLAHEAHRLRAGWTPCYAYLTPSRFTDSHDDKRSRWAVPPVDAAAASEHSGLDGKFLWRRVTSDANCEKPTNTTGTSSHGRRRCCRHDRYPLADGRSSLDSWFSACK